MLFDPSSIATIRISDPLRILSEPLEWLLTSGGDTRLAVDPTTKLNGYGCSPFPRPQAFTFASSTATSISSRAYAAVGRFRQNLLRQAREIGLERAVDDSMEHLRDDLKQQLGLEDSGCEVVFSPSGTDSQLHALFLARALLGGSVVSMLAASDETGSGATFATRGRHFGTVTGHGIAVTKGDPIRGLAEGITGISVPLHDEMGQRRPVENVDGDITHGIARTVAGGKRAVLFAMDSSKFGNRSPSADCLRWIADASGDDVQIVIDACQARLGTRRLRWYLDQGFMVLLTGSKFFTGAPFSGALLVPRKLAARCSELDDVPDGLGAYSSRSDWPRRFRGIRGGLPAAPINLGTLLRWVSALAEMRDYFVAPQSFREVAFTRFADAITGLIDAEPCLKPMPLPREVAHTLDDEEFASPTIHPFFVRRRGALLSYAQTKILYCALNDDVSALLPVNPPPMMRLLAARECHIGQPVALPDGRGSSIGVLRISAGARVVSESWCSDRLTARENLRGEFDQLRAIVEKIALVVRYFDAIETAYRGDQQPPRHVNAA
jgi:hypothetical protein